MAKQKRVAILLHGIFGYEEGILRGIAQFVAQRPDWLTLWQDPEPDLVDKVRAWQPDGIVGNLATKPLAADVLSMGASVVSVSANLYLENVPRVSIQNEQVAAMAVDYFWGLGFRRFACVSTIRRWSHTILHTTFVQRVAERGASCSTFTGWYPARHLLARDSTDPYPELRTWLTGLPKPVALFCVQDNIAVAAVEAAHECGIRVPDDMAVLGAGNSQMLCTFANPGLSSIVLPLEQVGHQACSILSELMDGAAIGGRQVLLSPVRVAERGSTDVIAVADPQVAAAMRFIRDNAHTPLSVEDILQHVTVSRRILEQRFRKALKCTPLEAVHATRIQRAMRLLCETELSMPEIAERAGFSNAVHLSTLFRAKTGLTPTKYRKQHRT
jgi:LacI family transcriptional regulator